MQDCNYSYLKIAATLDIAVSRAYETVKCHKETNNIKSLPRSGCPKALSDCDAQRIICEILHNHFALYSQITKLLHPISTMQGAEDCICSWLQMLTSKIQTIAFEVSHSEEGGMGKGKCRCGLDKAYLDQ